MKGTLGHRDRKNPKSAEAYKEQRRKRNADRPKQVVIFERNSKGELKFIGPVRA